MVLSHKPCPLSKKYPPTILVVCRKIPCLRRECSCSSKEIMEDGQKVAQMEDGQKAASFMRAKLGKKV